MKLQRATALFVALALCVIPESVLRMLRQLSPVTHITSDAPPTILIHGDADKAVPLQQSHRLIDRLHDANVSARLVVREGMGQHGLDGRRIVP